MQRVTRLWGKTGPGTHFHPAVFHMLDVGNVAAALLSPMCTPRIRNVLAACLGTDKPASLVAWLPLAVALHDIGKVSAQFQGRANKPRTRTERERLGREGFEFGHFAGETLFHQQISGVFIADDLPELSGSPSDMFVDVLRDAITGHHGTFAPEGDLTRTRDHLQYREPTEWRFLRAQAFALLKPLLASHWDQAVLDICPPHRMAATVALTGFIILCDWLGSDETIFKCCDGMTPMAYSRLSKDAARRAVVRAGFAAGTEATPYGGFDVTFPGIRDPRPLQKAIDAIDLHCLTWPTLVIIEAPTGEGKTEAALALAQRLAERGPSNEIYFALPTQATSNQMFLRVLDYVVRTRGGTENVKLVHGQAFLAEDALRVQAMGDISSEEGRPLDWFSGRRLALLAPYGVGTVDQVELTALNARFYALRLFGLAGKTVIIDEVHAYDTYMSTVLQGALRWLGALGSSVLLLSATLPANRHRELAAAYLEGRGKPLPSRDHIPYPAISIYGPTTGAPITFHSAAQQRTICITFVEDRTVEAQCERLLSMVERGGAICRICNTVAEAQKLFAHLDKVAPQEVERVLIHARFPVQDRLAIEDALTREYGPDSRRGPTDRAVVVGTQVLEQSLDLDFDVMVSDMAPIDLLLQRVGRVRRHDRAGRQNSPAPLLVQLPRDSDRPLWGAWSYVYDEYVLWRTLSAIEERMDQGHAFISVLEGGPQLIEDVYGDSVNLKGQWADETATAWNAHVKAEKNLQNEARLRLTPTPHPCRGIAEGHSLQFEEDADGGKAGWGVAQTRFGAERVSVIPLYAMENGELSIDLEGSEGALDISDHAVQLRLLQRQIPLTVSPGRKQFAESLRQENERHQLFRNAVLLRHCLPLVFTHDRARWGGTLASLDPRLGLLLQKEVTG